jgi:modulator of FtsH protease
VIAAWQPFFGMTAGAAASLTGLLFVALSLRLRKIAAHPAHRHRARASLAALALVLVLSGLVLVPGQTGTALGLAELLALALYRGLYSASLAQVRTAARPTGLPRDVVVRNGVAVCLMVSASVGAVLVLGGSDGGLDVLACFCLLAIAFMVFNSWGMLVGSASE